MLVRQAVILCGGLGTRLGELTADTPKPLLEVNGAPFLETLIREIGRSGIREFLLLAGHFAEKVQEFAASLEERLGRGFSIAVSVERKPAGTGGALALARAKLEDNFLLLNGDSFLDFPIHELGAAFAQPGLLGAIALREVPDVARYGEVSLSDGKVSRFLEKTGEHRPGLINGGVYLLSKAALDLVAPGSSLERDFLPKLAEQGRLAGKAFDSFFIDIGLPESFAEAGRTLNAHRHRPAVFLDRDGVLNRDLGHVGTADRWVWNGGAIDAIRRINRAGYYAFVVTNQAGIAKGKYALDDYWRLRDHVRGQSLDAGAQIDDERFCPYHPDGVIKPWCRVSDWRKPAPGMIDDLLTTWPVDRDRSFLVGDKQSDLEAATAAGIRSHLFTDGNLDTFIAPLLSK
jgi:D-glycero-D-manno-heptose 1,7-bisphosphate phosphatase